MIFVDGHLFSATSSQGSDVLGELMQHPKLVMASASLKDMGERKFSVLGEGASHRTAACRWVYVFQREYATVNPTLVDFVGTDEATTCVGIVIRNRKSGLTSVAHMDSPSIVDIGLTQMLSSLSSGDSDVNLDVHLLGGFEDVPLKFLSKSHRRGERDGFSFPLCTKIIETLTDRTEKFHIQTFFVLGHNTKRDSAGNVLPIFNGFLVGTSTGSLIPASFDRSTRCPDETVRRIRVTACSEDPRWKGKMLDTYDTETDQFVIPPCSWTSFQLRAALILRELSDPDILLECSTSPFAEAVDFVDNLRRQWDYIVKHPDWRNTFVNDQSRVFKRTLDGAWSSTFTE